MSRLQIIVVLALGTVSCAREVRVSEGCASVVVPKGWVRDTRVPPGVLMTFRSLDKSQFGGVESADVVRVDAFPADGMTLADLKDKLTGVTLAEVQRHVKEDLKPGLTVRQLRPPVVTSTSVGSTPALRIVVDTDVTTEGKPVATRTVTVAALVGGRFYGAVGGYPVAREQQMKPLVDMFLASFRLERCGAF